MAIKFAAFTAIMLLWDGQVADAQNAVDGISVTGTADIKTRPNMVEIDVRVSGKAELADDALLKYQQALKGTLAGFNALKISNLKVTERGMTLSPGDSQAAMQAMMRGMNPPAEKLQVEVIGPVRLQLSGIDKLTSQELFRTIGKLLDVARDSGAILGATGSENYRQYYYGGQQRMPSIVRFVLRDLREVREQAYEKAVGDARMRAERLARLTGIKLGPAIAVNELQVSGDEITYTQQPYQQMGMIANTSEEPALVSDSFLEIPFRVKLMVRFSIQKQDKDLKTAQR